MMHFRIRDLVSVLLYRAVLARTFAAFGAGVRVIWPLRIVGSRYVRLGEQVTLQYGAYIAVLNTHAESPLLAIGSGTQIGNHAHIICTHDIDIGTKVLIADRVYIADNRHQYEDVGRPVMDQPLMRLNPVSIGSGSWIGENVCVLGCRIGRNCVIGANSVVTRDIPDYSLAMGSPAIPVKRYCPESGVWRRVDPAEKSAD